MQASVNFIINYVLIMLEYRGYLATTQEEIDSAMSSALVSERMSIINVMINPIASRKAQQHEWLTRAKL